MTPIASITVAPATERKSAPGRFELALQGAARTLAATVEGAVTLAAPAVPFGNVLLGAVRGGAAPALPLEPGLGGRLQGVVGAGSGGTAAGGVASSGTGGAGTSAASGGGDLLEATRALQQEAQAMNLQYLQLQEQMQRESREYTALSNVMKARHDSARAAIGNIH